MAQLLKYEKEIPNDFYSTKTHLWILKDGKIRMTKRQYVIHAEVWGDEAWEISQRGYYNDNHGLISCHGSWSDDLLNKLAKKFPRAMFYKDWE